MNINNTDGIIEGINNVSGDLRSELDTIKIVTIEKIFFAVAASDEYFFTLYAPCSGTMLSCTQKALSFTTAGTYTVKINSTDVGGLSTVTNSTTLTTTNATSANAFSISNTIKVVFSAAVVLGVNVEFTLRYQIN